MSHPRDEYGRAIYKDNEVPDPWDPESVLAQWHGRTCGPNTVISLSERDHRVFCDQGWTRNDQWSFVCGRCHPTAVDMPGHHGHQRTPEPKEGT